MAVAYVGLQQRCTIVQIPKYGSHNVLGSTGTSASLVAATSSESVPVSVPQTAATAVPDLSQATYFQVSAGRALPRAPFAADFYNALAQSVSVPRNTGAGARLYRTWNQFQEGTVGQFGSRAEAAKAWSVYKEANGIVTGTVRSQAASRQFLRSLADDYRTPSWMKPWLREGRRPPGYEVDHIKPLSIDGEDVPANMRLQGADLHGIHHKWYDPWNW